MKKNDWIYLAKAMWTYSNNHEGRISNLLKELIQKINTNMEVIIDDEKNDETTGSHGVINTDSTSNFNFEGTGEF